MLGISFDPVEANAAFAAKYHFPFPLLSDTDRRVGLAYGVAADAKAAYARRVTFVIGPDGKIEQVIDPVDARSHAETLLPSLR